MRVTDRDPLPGSDERDTPPGMAGALLRVGRESAGMTIDAVAQQLKLAPRQVKALEDGDYSHLPGRTFVRGFVRNYARLVNLDPERVLGALPAGASAAALDAPTLQPTAPTIGELPTSDHSKTGWARWAIPVTLAAIVAVAATYEWRRPAGEPHLAAGKDAAAPPAPAASAPSNSASTAPTPAPQEAAGTSLPNPIAGASPATATPAAAPDVPSVAARAGAPEGTSPAAPNAVAQGPAPGEQAVVLAYRDNSWTEIRDRDGRVLISGMHPGGTAQTVSGSPPLLIVIGNASDVSLRYKGEAVDLAPYTRQNVARLSLP
jgi:cytoskeleton protein RodZ